MSSNRIPGARGVDVFAAAAPTAVAVLLALKPCRELRTNSVRGHKTGPNNSWGGDQIDRGAQEEVGGSFPSNQHERDEEMNQIEKGGNASVTATDGASTASASGQRRPLENCLHRFGG